MRIAQMISGTGVDGPSRCCAMLSRQLVMRGHEVTLFHRPRAWIADAVDDTTISLVAFGRGVAELRRVQAVLREKRIDVLHTHMTGASNFGALLRVVSGVPVVATLHTGRPRSHWRFNNRAIALSRPTFDQACGVMGPHRVALIPNFVEAAATGPFDRARRAALMRGLGIAEGAFVVGCVGKVSPDKGQMDLVGAMARVLQAGIDCRLVLIGPIYGDEGKAIMERARTGGLEGRVAFTGLRQDVPAMLETLDVFASSSVREEMSIAVMEAMAAGLPIVATHVGGLPLLVAEGRNGFLTDVGAVAQIADRLIALARSPELRRAMGAASLERVATDYSAQVIVPRIEATLAEAAAEGRRWRRAVAMTRAVGSAA